MNRTQELQPATAAEAYPVPGPSDTLTGFPLSAQKNATGLMGELHLHVAFDTQSSIGNMQAPTL